MSDTLIMNLMCPDIRLGSYFVKCVLTSAFLDIVEEEMKRLANDDNEDGDKKPDFIN
jgi:hypothetical protein